MILKSWPPCKSLKPTTVTMMTSIVKITRSNTTATTSWRTAPIMLLEPRCKNLDWRRTLTNRVVSHLVSIERTQPTFSLTHWMKRRGTTTMLKRWSVLILWAHLFWNRLQISRVKSLLPNMLTLNTMWPHLVIKVFQQSTTARLKKGEKFYHLQILYFQKL